MKQGIITKGIGGFYYVQTSDGVIECRARGVFRNKSVKPLPGDVVEIELLPDGSGSVVSILPRKNHFIRPPISNIDCFVIVAAVKNPCPDFKFIDKMLVIAEANGIEAIICFNKSDLLADLCDIGEIYRDIGYKVIETSTIDHFGIDELISSVTGKTTAFVGFSGVGKSSLLNEIFTGLNLQTGDISNKLRRGRHTTRHIELFSYDDNTYIADTPGFSMLEIPAFEPNDLQRYFPEFKKHISECKFTGCAHLARKKCGVISAVEQGMISRHRYENYLEFYNYLKVNKESYPK